MQITQTVLLLVVLPVVIMGQTNYCNFGADHTMCQYSAKPCQVGEQDCKRGLAQTDIDGILKLHNDYRSKVAQGLEGNQPKGSNIRELTYSEELATIAQRWADQCRFGHDANRRTAEYLVGQNAAISMSSQPTNGVVDFTSGINSWYNEVKQFDPNSVSSFQFSYETGHYSQVLWAETDKIGCGFSYYKNGNQYDSLFICNYGIAGNMGNSPVYEIGEPASACKKGVSLKYPALCA